MTELKVGDRVRVRLDARLGLAEGWYPGTVFRIDPYSAHRRFYWVELDPDVQSAIGLQQISVLNPKNIEKFEPPAST
jgi:hypothetical protein